MSGHNEKTHTNAEGIEYLVEEFQIGERGGTISYDICGSPESGYEGQIEIQWTYARDDVTIFRFDSTGITSVRGVLQIEASFQEVLENVIALDDGDESGRGYALFCEMACYLPTPREYCVEYPDAKNSKSDPSFRLVTASAHDFRQEV